MLKTITVERFKSLYDVQLELGHLNIFIGTNASGKSNFFDALRVLQGFNYGFSVGEVFDGKPKGSSSAIWNGIRGGSGEAVTKLAGVTEVIPDPTIRLASTHLVMNNNYQHDIVFNLLTGAVPSERFSVNGKLLFETYDSPVSHAADFHIIDGNAFSITTKADLTRSYLYRLEQPATTNVSELLYRYIHEYLIDANDLQFLDLDVETLRQYSKNQSVRRIGDHGEDFAALVQSLIANSESKEDYLSWLRELIPSEIDDVVILKGALGEPLFAIKDNRNTFAAQVLSDGTLRFAALAAALFQPDEPSMLLVEEIENGIHPTRLRLMVELLKSRAEHGRSQIFVTTHSPIVLAWLKPEDYSHTFLCVRSADGSSQIRPVSSLPHFMETVQRSPFADLFAEGWLETTL
jgi:energy-coupling factor transporter ATP-binding protein EcfA2